MHLKKLNCIQINLQHCQAASYNLCNELDSLHTYIALIQEPWVCRGAIKESPRNATKHVGASRLDRPRLCVYTSKDLDTWMLPQYSNSDVVTVSISNLEGIIPKTVIFASVYMAEENTAPPRIMEELTAYCMQNNLPLVIGCDANAHHVAWGSTNTNERGEALIEYLASTNLAWCNKGHKPTFVTRNRKEVLDLTLATPEVFTKIKDWSVSDRPSLSDHEIITFHFTIAKPPEQWYRNVRKTNWKDYQTYLSVETRNLLHGEINSTNELDTLAEGVTKCINNAFKKSCQLKRVGNKHEPNPWWNEELASLKKETARLGRKAGRLNQEADWDSFKESRKTFKKEIRKAKRQSWRELCEQTEGLPPLARLYRILKWDANSKLGSIEKSDGSFTNSPEETLQCMLDIHLKNPEDPEPAVVQSNIPLYYPMGEEIFTEEKARYALE